MDARRLVLLGTPVAFGLASLLHPLPRGRSIVDALEPSLGRWLTVHVIQLLLLGLLAATLWPLVDGCPGRAPTVCRLALVPFLAFYSAFDAVVGIGTGTLVGLARGPDGEARAEAVRMIQTFWDERLTPGTAIFLVIGVALVSWLVAAGAGAGALRQAGARRAVVLFVAMACLGAATWLRTRARA
jgi:hypothetical protein